MLKAIKRLFGRKVTLEHQHEEANTMPAKAKTAAKQIAANKAVEKKATKSPAKPASKPAAAKQSPAKKPAAPVAKTKSVAKAAAPKTKPPAAAKPVAVPKAKASSAPKADPKAKTAPAKPAKTAATKPVPTSKPVPAAKPVAKKTTPPAVSKAGSAKAASVPVVEIKPAEPVSTNLKASSSKSVSSSKKSTSKKTEPTANFTPYKEKTGEEYMNDAQKAHFRKLLMDWKKELMQEVDRTVSHMKDEAANFPDPADRATQEEEFSLELRARDRERKLIKKIDSTLEMIEQDSYGYCEACGIEVGVRRLEARPTATLCIDCKTLAEIKEKQIGG
jgi:DnaK suppressor protein